jgi:hypothetical protein
METQQEAMKSEFPSTPEEAFEASLEGAYYRKEMAKLRKDGRLTNVPYDPNGLVDTWWDIGYDDYTAIVFVQQIGKELHIIDYLEGSGEALPYYAKELKERPYVYGQNYGPHDLMKHELQTGKTTFESAAVLGVNFVVVPRISVQDGINAVRRLFPSLWIDKAKCATLVNRLDNYRKEWNENLGQFKSEPLHDENSHGADAVRYGAVMFAPPVNEEKTKREESFDPHNPFNQF